MNVVDISCRVGALTLLCAATPARAGGSQHDEDRFSGSATFDTEIRVQRYDPAPLVHSGGSKPRFVEQLSRWVIQGRYGDWTARVQLDQLVFAGLPHVVDGVRKPYIPPMQAACPGPAEMCLANPLRSERPGLSGYINPEKVALEYRKGDVELSLGDFYQSVGVGAVMNINRNVDNDVDTSIQGARLKWQPGDWEVTALAGTLNRQQVFQDQLNVLQLDGDRRHTVGLMQVKRYGIGATTLGVHGLLYNYVDPPSTDRSVRGLRGLSASVKQVPDALIAGTTASTSVAGVEFSGEVSVVSYPESDLHSSIFVPALESRSPGVAAYGSSFWFAGRTTWQVEARYLRNVYRLNNPIPVQYGYTVAAPPTLELERAINIDTAAVTGSNALGGGLVRVDVTASDNTTPYVAVGVTRDEDLVNAAQKSPAPETILQLQGGVEVLAGEWGLLVESRARTDIRDGDYGADKQLYSAVDIKNPVPLGSSMQTALVGQYFVHGQDNSLRTPDPWHEINVSVGYLVTPAVGLTLYYDHTTNPVAGGNGNLREDWPSAYGAAEVFWKPSTDWTVKAFHGGYAAGIRCSGGQCRNVPAFTGSRIAVVGTFD